MLNKVKTNGRLAQLVERLPYKQDVISSSLVLPMNAKAALQGGFFVTLHITLPLWQACTLI